MINEKSFTEINTRIAAVDLKNLNHKPMLPLKELKEMKREVSVLGGANETVKRLFIVWNDLRTDLKALHDRAGKMDEDSDEFKQLVQEHSELHELCDLAAKLFWNEARVQFPAANDGDFVAIIDDWQIVTGKDKEEVSHGRGVGIITISSGMSLGEAIFGGGLFDTDSFPGFPGRGGRRRPS